MNSKEYALDGPFFFAFEFPFSYELLKNDEDYVLNLFKLWPHYLVDYNIFYSVASLRLLQSKEFITELLKSETKGSVLWSWKEFPTSYWSDEEFVKAALKINGDALQYANDIYKKNKEIVIEALKSSKSVIQFVDESLKNDKDVLALLSIKSIENKDSEDSEDLPF
jgi:serine/threonine-protein kinase TTK/MPS1